MTVCRGILIVFARMWDKRSLKSVQAEFLGGGGADFKGRRVLKTVLGNTGGSNI